MYTRVILTATSGRLAGEEFVFTSHTLCVIGRANDCWLQVPDRSCKVSRHHCLLEIDPPAVMVQDLGSLNGTFVNGQRIGHRPRDVRVSEMPVLPHARRTLQDGDELRVGDSLFTVHVIAVPEDATEMLTNETLHNREAARGPVCLA
jgi:pSer/pThr/pTyr-binding forkhead associated (FHA) protein